MKSIYDPAFSVFRKSRSITNYSIVISLAMIGQVGALSLYWLVTHAISDSGGDAGRFFYWALAGSVLFLVGLYLYLVMVITGIHSVPAMANSLDRFGSGDLSLVFLPGWGTTSEAQSVWHALNKMNKDFPNLVRGVRAGAQSIADGSREIAVGYTDLSQRTTEQASTLEEAAASMEELSATVKQNAEHCRNANQAVEEVGGRAEEAARAMHQVTSTMTLIENSTKKMKDSVSLIDSIAFQTNILALNANVEAARAGEQGRGFAVVAAEVRALAQRSAQATEEIKALINGSSGNVTQGSALVTKAEEAVNRAVVGIRRVVEIINDVATASAEQSAGMQMIGKALNQLETVTQQNAALVEEGAAAATSFEQEATQLMQAVDIFRLQEETPDHALTTGSFRTAVRNYQMGPLATAFTFPALALLVRTRHVAKITFTGVPLFLGSLITLIAALAAAQAGANGFSSTAIAATIVVCGALVVGPYFYLSLSTWGKIGTGYLERISKKLAAGDLSWTVKVHAEAEAKKLEGYLVNTALRKIHSNFTNVVRQVRASSDRVVGGSREIAQGYTNLSQRTEEQASTLEETAASMEEMTATVKQNANHCHEANVVAKDVGGLADEAAKSMQQVTSVMTRIEESANQMSGFANIIESIAFQTNILALNAAVESARAGEQGRGFAVVAAEVRALAQRSAKATEEIKALIAASTTHVSEGATLVTQAEQAVSRSVEGIRGVVDVISTIAEASAEQNAGMQQIGKALTQLETATQQNAALVEEGAASTAAFEQHANRLAQMVGVFQLERKDKDAPSQSNTMQPSSPELPTNVKPLRVAQTRSR